jgi:hypothetical protein
MCSVVPFLWAEGLNAKDIHNEMFPVFCGKCLWRKAVHSWMANLLVAEKNRQKISMLRVSTHW